MVTDIDRGSPHPSKKSSHEITKSGQTLPGKYKALCFNFKSWLFFKVLFRVTN